MTWVPPTGGSYGQQPDGERPDSGSPDRRSPQPGSSQYGEPRYGSSQYGAPAQSVAQGPGGSPHPAAPVKERELRAQRALRALPPPPGPPPGMGAVPAFAPPVPRPNRTVLIVSLVLGATLLVFCGVGVVGVGGLFYYTYNTAQDQAQTEVETYLGDLRAGRFPQAYSRLCDEARAERSVNEFTEDERAAGQVVSYQVSDRVQVDQDSNWVLTAQVTRQGNTVGPELFPVTFESGNTAEICPQ